jgi:uncharacterized protein YdaU (DUF1376 family)
MTDDNHMQWYKRDCDAALVGMAELTLEECGAYNRLLDLLYSRNGNVPDDDVMVATMMRVDVRTWRRLKARLIAHGKVWIIQIQPCGQLMAKRVEKTISDAGNGKVPADFRRTSGKLPGRSSPDLSRKPNDFNKNRRQILDTRYKKEKSGFAASHTCSQEEKTEPPKLSPRPGHWQPGRGGAPSTWSDEFPWQSPTVARHNGHTLPPDQLASWELLALAAQPNPDRAAYLQQFRKTILHAKPPPAIEDQSAEPVAAENEDASP